MKKTNATAPDSQQFVRVAGWFETFTAAADGESGIKELRCDLFSINSLAAAMHVRKAEIVFWIDKGWLETTKEGQGRTVAYLISPDALQRCLRGH